MSDRERQTRIENRRRNRQPDRPQERTQERPRRPRPEEGSLKVPEPKDKWRLKFEELKAKVIKFGKYVWTECKDWRTLVLLGIVMILAYTPVWLGYLLFHLFKWKWCLAMATGYMLFWAGPATPFIPLCIAITLAIKRVLWTRGMLPEPANTEEKRVTVYKKRPQQKKKKDSFLKPVLDLLKYMKS